MVPTTKLLTELRGTTKHYSGYGRKLGYPTANIATTTDLADGVYFGFADIVGLCERPALIFIGTPTTVGDTERRVEAHVLDIADVDYYDQQIILRVVYFHRSNKTFDSIDDLQVVMQQDEATARQWFANE